MADSDIFRKQALDTVSNPEQLDQHVRITKPSVWIIVIGILAICGYFVYDGLSDHNDNNVKTGNIIE